jgi:hypothetical protein
VHVNLVPIAALQSCRAMRKEAFNHNDERIGSARRERRARWLHHNV